MWSRLVIDLESKRYWCLGLHPDLRHCRRLSQARIGSGAPEAGRESSRRAVQRRSVEHVVRDLPEAAS